MKRGSKRDTEVGIIPLKTRAFNEKDYNKRVDDTADCKK